MSEAVVLLKKGEGRSLKAGGLWVYDNEIDTIKGTFHNGDIVAVHDFDGYAMGRGFINQNSKIRVRMMTRRPNQQVDEEFLKERVQAAWNYRKDTVDTLSCRVIFGEADFLPGIVIDKYEDVLVVESLALGIDRFKETIVTLLKEALLADGLKNRGVVACRALSVSRLIRMWRLRKMACAIWWTWQTGRKQGFSLIRNTTGLRYRNCAGESVFWTALRIWGPLR